MELLAAIPFASARHIPLASRCSIAMGKVRAAQDKVPKVKDGSSKAKKITFNVDVDDDSRIADTDDNYAAVEDGVKSKAPKKGRSGVKAKAKDAKERAEEEEEAPEEVRADTEEVRKLREWHEQLLLGKDTKKKRKSSSSSNGKQKEMGNNLESGSKYDKEIDPSILEEVDEDEEEEEEEEEDNDEEEQGQEVSGRINKHSRKSRRIDNVLVTVLDEQRLADPFRTFKPHKEADRFLGETLQRSEGRVRYARFAAGKRGGPAIKFALA